VIKIKGLVFLGKKSGSHKDQPIEKNQKMVNWAFMKAVQLLY
jgi:hypothetical protein